MKDVELDVDSKKKENEGTQDIETKKTLGIDINKINEGTRKNFIYDFQEMNLRKSSNSNSNESEEENSIENNSMIQKSPLLELDSPTKEFECIFPDFYLIDNIGFLYNKRIRKRRKSVTDTIGRKKKDNENEGNENNNNQEFDFSTIDKNVNEKSVIDLLIEKGIHQISSNLEFEIGNLLYQNKHEIFKGKYHPLNDDQEDVFIKKMFIRNKEELNIVINEIKILFKLMFKDSKSTLQINPFINKLLHFYFDSNERCLFTFFEYEDITLMKEIITIENSTDTEKTINRQKLYLVHKLLHLLVMLHSNRIIHRDIRSDLFYFSPKKDDESDIKGGFIKTFDFTTAYMFSDNVDMTKIEELTNKISNESLFLTPRFVSPELTSLKPVFGWGEDIWSFSCLCIEIFIKYKDYQDEMISRLINRIFRGDDYLKESSINNKEEYNNDNKNEKNENNSKKSNNNSEDNSNNNDKNNSSNNNSLDGDIINNKKIIELKYAIPKIPKTIPLEIAQVIAICFYIEPRNRPNIITLIDKFNGVFREYGIVAYDITKSDKENLTSLLEICRIIYLNAYNEKTNPKKERWVECPYHKNSFKNYYCETCKDFFCRNSIVMAHKDHMFEVLYGTYEVSYKDYDDNDQGVNKNRTIEIEEFFSEKNILKGYQVDLEKLEMEKNFKIIEEFSQSFEEDYIQEKNRIDEQYKLILKKIDDLEKHQIFNLNAAKEKFELNYQKLFHGSQKLEDYCSSLYSTKALFFSHLNRFYSTLKNNILTSDNYNLFRSKIDKFLSFSESLISSGQSLKERSAGLYEPGKYIFRHELYSEDIQKYLKSLETKIISEKMKFFDYSDSDSLFLTKELIMIIPLTNCVFSYSRNSYKKFRVDFEKNKVKLNSFLPGCATLHQDNFFYITGGEIKDEATSNFLLMSIDEKVIFEKIEMNYPRRFHSMLSIKSKDKKYIMVIGGWDCNEVEYINSIEMNKWVSLPKMKYKRSDPTVYFFDSKFIYVFGGWDYSQKKCVGEVERYKIFNHERDDDIIQDGVWENVKIKGETISLQKYNMGLISLYDEKTENSEKIILVGGFDESYDYSQSVIKIEIMQMEDSIFVNKDIKGLPTGGESSFWYEKQFHIMSNDLDGEEIAVNFNCFNNIYVYTYRTSEFKQYANSTAKN